MTTADQPRESHHPATAQPRTPTDNRKRSGDVRREGTFCGCGMQRSVTGVCVNCD